MWRFLVQSNLVPGESFREQFELLARWGYDGLEVSGADVLNRGEELRRAMEAFPDMVVSACAGFEGWLVDRNPRARNLAIAQIKAILAAGNELGILGLISPAAFGIDSRGVLPPFRSAYTLEEDRALLIDGLIQIVESAEVTGGTLLLEPLNRYVDRVLNTLEEAVSVIQEIGSPVIRLIPDTYHMNIEEADIAASLHQYAPFIGHVHLSDSNRRLPGFGHIDFASVFAALRNAGYDGTFALECQMTGDPHESLPQALAFLKEEAGL